MSGTESFAKEVADFILSHLKKTGVPTKELYSLDESAEYLACSREQVRNFIAAGKLTATNIDARPRIARADLDEFIKASKG